MQLFEVRQPRFWALIQRGAALPSIPLRTAGVAAERASLHPLFVREGELSPARRRRGWERVNRGSGGGAGAGGGRGARPGSAAAAAGEGGGEPGLGGGMSGRRS